MMEELRKEIRKIELLIAKREAEEVTKGEEEKDKRKEAVDWLWREAFH